MLSWPSGPEWARDNNWQRLHTVPMGVPVDVFAYGFDDSKPRGDEQVGRRFHGCRWDGLRWHGVPDGWEPQFWVEAMTQRRVRELTVR